MRKSFYVSLFVILSGSLAAQTNNARSWNGSKIVFEGQPASIRLAPHVTTTIRLPEPVNSVIVGDPTLFQAEYSPNEPLLVFAKAATTSVAQTNLVISTVRGRQFVLLLQSLSASGDQTESAADLLVVCQASGPHFIEESFLSALIPETISLGNRDGQTTISADNDAATSLDAILSRQRRQKLATLHGDRIRVGIGPVTDDGSRLLVPFSVLNSKTESIELVSPQVQLAGLSKSGMFHRSRWTTVQQIPVQAFQISQRRIGPGDRADGVVLFERPAIKQSTEGLFLQIADSAAIDQPVLAPINFRQISVRENDHE